jgi:hypothetical protein
MLRWARSVVRRLEDQGIDVKVVAPGFGAGPRRGKGAEGQRVLIQENEASAPNVHTVANAKGARAEGEVGARWALDIDDKGVDVALEIPASATGAVAALRDTLDDDERRLELASVLETLPEQFTFGLVGDPGVLATDLLAWDAILARSLSTGRSVRLGWSVPRDVAVAHSSVLDEQLEDTIVLLAPVYQFLANAAASERGKFGDARKRIRGRAPLSSRGGARPLLSSSRRRDAEGARESSTSTFERGTRVRVLAGPFAGKVGVVKELDGKGRAQVMLGLLATRIDLADLSASSGGRRPTLSSSHRKPLALR